jgi:hypothetical protein
MRSAFAGRRPDVTPAQLVGLVVAGVPVIATLLRAFGVFDLSQEQEDALSSAVGWACGFGAVLLASDAGLRAARNAADSRRDAAALAAPVTPHAEPPVVVEPDEDDLGDELELIGVGGPETGTVPDSPGDLR